MQLKEKDIEDLIYGSPWLLDERFLVANIKGVAGSGRQVNVGKNGINRYIDLLFKDTRDDRPVIIELKKEPLTREHVAQILEYRGLIVSLDEKNRAEWQNEFGINYYSPKMILVGQDVSEEIMISANLCGIEVRKITGQEKLEVDFSSIANISEKLNQWNLFLQSGNKTLEERGEWVNDIYKKIVSFTLELPDITTSSMICKTSSKNSYIFDEVYPFINIPINYQEKALIGLYEFYDGNVPFSDKYIYCDFVIDAVDEIKEEDQLSDIKKRVKSYLRDKDYMIYGFRRKHRLTKYSRKGQI